MDANEPAPGISGGHESTASAVPLPEGKDMLGRIWVVAELLAQAAHQKRNIRQSERASEKTQA